MNAYRSSPRNKDTAKVCERSDTRGENARWRSSGARGAASAPPRGRKPLGKEGSLNRAFFLPESRSRIRNQVLSAPNTVSAVGTRADPRGDAGENRRTAMGELGCQRMRRMGGRISCEFAAYSRHCLTRRVFSRPCWTDTRAMILESGARLLASMPTFPSAAGSSN
jgi:hypothetical protein